MKDAILKTAKKLSLSDRLYEIRIIDSQIADIQRELPTSIDKIAPGEFDHAVMKYNFLCDFLSELSLRKKELDSFGVKIYSVWEAFRGVFINYEPSRYIPQRNNSLRWR